MVTVSQEQRRPIGEEGYAALLADHVVYGPPRPQAPAQNDAVVALGGPIAELRRFRYSQLEQDQFWATAWSGDLANARARYDGKLTRAIRRADRLLRRHWRAVERVADALLQRGELTGEEVMFYLGRWRHRQ
jgi:hypothetical protein